jgi:hypothetical protein
MSDIEVYGQQSTSALRRLAQSRGVDLATVLKAAREDRLIEIVEMRDRRTYWDGRHVRDPLDALLYLKAKEAVWQERLRRALAR